MAVHEAKEFVEVVDGDGNPIDGFEHPVPKSWVGTPLLPPGAKAKSNRSGRSKPSADSPGSEDNKTESEGS